MNSIGGILRFCTISLLHVAVVGRQ
jgi:hypothetical protein